MLKMFHGGVAGAPRPYQADQSLHLPYYVKLTEALTAERECLSAPAGEFPPPSPLLTVQRDTHTHTHTELLTLHPPLLPHWQGGGSQ